MCAIGLCVYFAAFTVVVIGLQAARSIRPEHESNIYKLLVIMVIACAVMLVALFSFGARKVTGLIATFGSTEALDRSSVAALRLLPVMVRAATRFCLALLISVLAAGGLLVTHYARRSLVLTWIAVAVLHLGFCCACFALCRYVEVKNAIACDHSSETTSPIAHLLSVRIGGCGRMVPSWKESSDRASHISRISNAVQPASNRMNTLTVGTPATPQAPGALFIASAKPKHESLNDSKSGMSMASSLQRPGHEPGAQQRQVAASL